MSSCPWSGATSSDLCTTCVQEGRFEGLENGPKQRKINNRLASRCYGREAQQFGTALKSGRSGLSATPAAAIKATSPMRYARDEPPTPPRCMVASKPDGSHS